ncbi:MAG: DUF1697 domain-containing protein [Microbacterium sp.]|nr:MAG: DUF1697 domain-containing protein [Microbacterium sp.]
MPSYLAFLRAINLGAKRVFPQGDIQRVVGEVGFENVQTHINTGNVRFDSRMRSRPKIETVLEQAFARDRGFDVPSIVFPVDEFLGIAADAEELHAAHPGLARHYVYLLKDEPDAASVRALAESASDKGEMVVRGRAAHALLKPGYQDGRVDPLGAVRHLGVATNRNVTVIRTLAQKWC